MDQFSRFGENEELKRKAMQEYMNSLGGPFSPPPPEEPQQPQYDIPAAYSSLPQMDIDQGQVDQIMDTNTVLTNTMDSPYVQSPTLGEAGAAPKERAIMSTEMPTDAPPPKKEDIERSMVKQRVMAKAKGEKAPDPQDAMNKALIMNALFRAGSKVAQHGGFSGKQGSRIAEDLSFYDKLDDRIRGAGSGKPMSAAEKARIDIANRRLKLQEKMANQKWNEKKKKEPKQWQLDAASFAERMWKANKQINELGDNWAPHIIGSKLPNVVKSEEQQLYDNAMDLFATAQLRDESGAAISLEEFKKEMVKYGPKPGDKPEVLAKKRAGRDAAIKAMIRKAGIAWTPELAGSMGAPSADEAAGKATGTLSADDEALLSEYE